MGFPRSTLFLESTPPSRTDTAWGPQPSARSSSGSLPMVCRCGGRSDGVFQVGDGGPEAVASTPVEHPGSWPRPGDLCGPHR